MTEFKNKNIGELLSKFFPPDQAEQIKNDFASGDALFEKFPAPNPSQQTLTNIKRKITQQLARRGEARRSPKNQKRIRWTAVLVKTAVAAAIIIIVSAVILLNFNQKKPNQYTKNEHRATLWQNEEISTFDAEIKQLNSELLAINLGEEFGANGILTDRVDQLELEIIETENTFWKG